MIACIYIWQIGTDKRSTRPYNGLQITCHAETWSQLLLQFLLDFNFSEGFKHVAYLDVIEVYETNTTLKVGSHLLHIILISLQGVDRSSVHHDTIAHHASFVRAVYFAFCVL